MRSTFVTFLVASILGVAVFGAFNMNHESGHGTTQDHCIAATAQGGECNRNASPLDFALFHIGALKDFSLATFDASAVSAMVFVLFSVVIIALIFLSRRLFQLPQFSWYRQKARGSLAPLRHTQKLTRWLAFHENSPSSF